MMTFQSSKGKEFRAHWVILYVCICIKHVCRSTLTDPGFVKTLYENDIIVWGGDVRDREAWSGGCFSVDLPIEC
jgi:hypothetical protein